MREEKTILSGKFEAAKELLQKTRGEMKQLQDQLATRQPTSIEVEGIKRELIQVSA